MLCGSLVDIPLNQIAFLLIFTYHLLEFHWLFLFNYLNFWLEQGLFYNLEVVFRNNFTNLHSLFSDLFLHHYSIIVTLLPEKKLFFPLFQSLSLFSYGFDYWNRVLLLQSPTRHQDHIRLTSNAFPHASWMEFGLCVLSKKNAMLSA